MRIAIFADGRQIEFDDGRDERDTDPSELKARFDAAFPSKLTICLSDEHYPMSPAGPPMHFYISQDEALRQR